MKKKKLVICTIILLVVLCGGICFWIASLQRGAGDTGFSSFIIKSDEQYSYLETEYYILKISMEDWNALDTLRMKYSKAADYLVYCGECIERLENRTGKHKWVQEHWDVEAGEKVSIQICMVRNVNSQVDFEKRRIYLNMNSLQNGISDIEHELTHLVMGECEEGTLSEGFATYMEYEEFSVANDIIYEMNADQVIQNLYFHEQYVEMTKEILNAIGQAYDSTIKHQRNGATFYVYAYSYVRYLVNTYGLETVVELFDASGSSEAYIQIIEKDVWEVKADWIEYLKQYQDEMTMEEIIQVLGES